MAPHGGGDLRRPPHRASLRYASRRDWAEVARDLKPVNTAVNEEEARQRLTDFDEKWGKRYPSIAGTWERAWSEFVPFLGLPDAIRHVVYTTNAIESLPATGAQPRRADTSPTNRPPSNASTWPPSPSTPPAAAASAGTTAGSPPSTSSTSSSTVDSPPDECRPNSPPINSYGGVPG
ncbi:transposase [Streptomyces canus]|nr:transposase [Streptomyces canus]MCX4862080.1 transposase [Streptomyces canus]